MLTPLLPVLVYSWPCQVPSSDE